MSNLCYNTCVRLIDPLESAVRSSFSSGNGEFFMRRIKLTQGKYALVDDADYELLSQYKWFFNSGYAAHKSPSINGKYKTIYMHRFVLKAQKGQECDHANMDTLDNRRANLRLCTHQQNSWNQGVRANNTSKYKGVYLQKTNGKWRARIMLNGKYKYLGCFRTAKEAALTYNKAALDFYGEYSNTNSL